MKKRLLSILLIIVMILAATSTIAFAGIKTYEVHNSGYVKLTVIGGSGKITWSSGKKSIATVNSKGKVKGIKAGTCTITAKRSGAKVSCKIKVLPYYENYRNIPDFGATVGKCHYKTYVEDGVNIAMYKAQNVKTAKKWVTTYTKKLKKNKYKKLDTSWVKIDNDEGYVVYVTREGKNIIVGYCDLEDAA